MASQFSGDKSQRSERPRGGGLVQLLDLQRIFALPQELLCITDTQSRFLRVSPSSSKILGYHPDEPIGRKLQDSNREFATSSYSVAHDLRGPLRAIAGFTGLLGDRHYETIDADGRRPIDRVLTGTQREMSNPIDDLLELGRVTRVEIRRRQVDLSEYARAILGRLREAAPKRAVSIVIEPRLRVAGDRELREIACKTC